MFILKANCSIYIPCSTLDPVKLALEALEKDLEGILGTPLPVTDQIKPSQLRILQVDGFEPESYSISVNEKSQCLEIKGSDALGILYGIYYFCEHILGVDPFGFWTDFEYTPKAEVEIPEMKYFSPRPKLLYRGWFINDEDCLTAWDDSISITDELWGQIFETILRAGYNTVIPGTGTTPEDFQLDTAHRYGLWIAQHHAEPLGASMFQDVFPGIEARIPEEKERFESLYRQAVLKSRDRRVLWTVGFRGQGDKAFFEDDSRYDSPEKRGRLIEEMICFQKQIVNEMTESPQVFLHYLYNESGDLYRSGHLQLPDDVIAVFCDNGFGGMRVRRDLFTKEPHIPTLPGEKEKHKQTGVYYHVSFHDLLISNKLVPLVHPEVLIENLEPFDNHSDFSYFICNVSNIRPHIFHMELLRSLWLKDDKKENLKERLWKRMDTWLQLHFPRNIQEIRGLLLEYFDTPFSFNDRYSDSKAGEQVYHHGLRRMIRGVIREEDFRHWFYYIEEPMEDEEELLQWLVGRAEGSLQGWRILSEKAGKTEKNLSSEERRFFRDNLGMFIDYSRFSCEGFVQGIRAVMAYRKGLFRESFCLFGKSRKKMDMAFHTLKEGEHGKWRNFYRGDWLTGTRETLRYLDSILSLCRIKGEDLVVNSSWMIEAMNLEQTAISILPQSTVSNTHLAEALDHRSSGSKKGKDLSILRDESL